jgi:hypothetical protein
LDVRAVFLVEPKGDCLAPACVPFVGRLTHVLVNILDGLVRDLLECCLLAIAISLRGRVWISVAFAPNLGSIFGAAKQFGSLYLSLIDVDGGNADRFTLTSYRRRLRTPPARTCRTSTFVRSTIDNIAYQLSSLSRRLARQLVGWPRAPRRSLGPPAILEFFRRIGPMPDVPPHPERFTSSMAQGLRRRDREIAFSGSS